MRTITFYSYKGGVGRTLAAANFAVYLANLGHRCVLMDFDLEAPGLDSKFDELVMPADQKGLLDYVLQFQQSGEDPGSLASYVLSVPLPRQGPTGTLQLLPAGNYLAPPYARNLSKLDWETIFSPQRAGVAFFQNLMKRVEVELGAEFVIIDSRTGISEIGGLCTQQLADEVVILSSQSKESIKVTRHLVSLIEHSEIARALGKTISAKVSRPSAATMLESTPPLT